MLGPTREDEVLSNGRRHASRVERRNGVAGGQAVINICSASANATDSGGLGIVIEGRGRQGGIDTVVIGGRGRERGR